MGEVRNVGLGQPYKYAHYKSDLLEQYTWIRGLEFISTKSENGQKWRVLYFYFFLMYLPVAIELVIIDYDIDSYA